MSDPQYQHINSATMKKLNSIVIEFYNSEQVPEEFIERLKEALPLHHTEESTWKRRLEGFYEVSELLVDGVTDKGNDSNGTSWNRQKVFEVAHIRPMNYYHRVSGFSAPDEMNLSDYLEAPTQALVKLEDDIFSLATLFRSLNKN
ncbi:hypothetical protein K8I28_06905 [bacterium]|nr:hypothetical protein [bacterium]